MVEKIAVASGQLLKDNRVFFYCFLIFVILGGLALISYPQGTLLEYFSANRKKYTDHFFYYFTKVGEEMTYVLVVVLFLFVRFRYALLVPLVGIIVTFVSFVSKALFAHPRPSIFYKNIDQLEALNVVEGVKLLGGLTSFPSGHTMSGFALFSLVAFLVPQKKMVAILLFLCAFLIGISRIYLMQHFLKDVYLGAIMGVCIAAIVYRMFATVPVNRKNWLDKNIRLLG